MSGEGTSDAVLAAAQSALRRLGSDPHVSLCGPPQFSAQAMIYRLGGDPCQPVYVVKVVIGDGLNAAAQYQALETCHGWWSGEDAHHIARPLALLHDCDGLLMQYVPGPTVSQLLRQALRAPAQAQSAAWAAGDFLRRFHAHGRLEESEVELGQLVDEIRSVAAAEEPGGVVHLPDAVERALDLTPRATLRAPRVRLHGDFTPRNLIVTGVGEVAMLDPLLVSEGLAEDDVAAFLTLMSSASVFAWELVSPRSRDVRRSLEQAFLTGYGRAVVSPVICSLRLILEQTWRWRYRRGRPLRPFERGLSSVRAGLVDAQMTGLLKESAADLQSALAETFRAARPAAGATVGRP